MKKGSAVALVFVSVLILIAFASVYLAFMKVTFFGKYNPLNQTTRSAEATVSARFAN